MQWTGTDHTYGSRYYVDAARKSGTLGGIKALILLDMIGDKNLNIRREENSTPLVDRHHLVDGTAPGLSPALP